MGRREARRPTPARPQPPSVLTQGISKLAESLDRGDEAGGCASVFGGSLFAARFTQKWSTAPYLVVGVDHGLALSIARTVLVDGAVTVCHPD